MSSKIFQDNVFPKHISDLMNLMHMVIFNNTDGEEKWESFLSLKQKEYVALSLAQYYQCDHCIDHHLSSLCRLEKTSKSTLSKNINSMILFLRINTKMIGESEKEHWINAWKRFSYAVSLESEDPTLPSVIGLAIGIARNDDFLIQFCGNDIRELFTSQGLDLRAAIGELESVVIYMKAAASKNRIVDKVESLFDSTEEIK